MAHWTDTAIFWHVFPLGSTGAEPAALPEGSAPVHRLPHLTGWLDHAVELGCNGLLLGPVFAAQTHGYDTVDHLRIDPRLGDQGDFDALVAAARERGVRLVLDGVFNHVGRAHPRVVEALAQGPGSAAGRWVRWRADGSPEVFEGHDGLVVLDHDSDEVAEHVAGVMAHWLDRGADGWRLDAAYAVPSAFWARVLPGVRSAHPEAWFLGEVIHGDYAAAVADGGLDTVTQYELWKAVWSSLNDRNPHELAHALGRHRDFAATFVPQTFVGNHDVTRIASALTDPRHLPHALALLFFVPGVPSVYYGDEEGFRGVKEDRAGGDDAVRPALPAGPGDLAPDGWWVRELHQRLIGLRRRHPWLARARLDVAHVSGGQLVATARGSDGESLALGLSVADEPVRLPVAGATVLAGADGAAAGGGALALPPHGWAVVGP